MKKWKYYLGVLALAAALAGCSTAPAVKEEAEPVRTPEEQYALAREEALVPIFQEADALAKGYFCEEAIALLQQVPEQFAGDPEVAEKLSAYEERRDKLVPYEEPVRHIFFHSLIVDTDRAFDGDYMANGYNYWMTTVGEFERILQQMYEKGYILIDIHELADIETDENGQEIITKKTPMVPEGKIPFILSIDDVNYYDYMKNDGFARKLLLDENGDVKNLYVEEDGTEKIGNYDVMPILDAFVEEHPDFSYRGVKGIIAETGYEGALGYRTNDLESETYEEDVAAAKAVADRLKETGWQFAVHGYGHRHTRKISLDLLKEDTEKWKREVGSIVGDTDIYIYPYGEEIDYPGKKLDYLKEQGFHYFCGVWTKPFVKVTEDYIRNTRCNLDGYTMINKHEVVLPMIDTYTVLDPARPPLE